MGESELRDAKAAETLPFEAKFFLSWHTRSAPGVAPVENVVLTDA
jgi:hypothetical protein